MAVSRARVTELLPHLLRLSESQLAALEGIVAQFERSFRFTAGSSSDLVSECVLQEFGDTLRIHHCFSAEPFTKDKFEYAVERVFTLCGTESRRGPRGLRGHDVTIGARVFP